jgi:hypothetical protein
MTIGKEEIEAPTRKELFAKYKKWIVDQIGTSTRVSQASFAFSGPAAEEKNWTGIITYICR